MGIPEKIVDTFEDIYRGLAAIFALSPEFIIDWQTTVGDEIIMTNRGEMISFLALDGYCGIVGENELNRIIESVQNATAALFGSSGMEMTFMFIREKFFPDEIHDILLPAFETADQLSLNLRDVLESKKNAMLKWTRRESVLIIIKTTVDSLTKSERKEIGNKIKKYATELAKKDKIKIKEKILKGEKAPSKVGLSRGMYAAFPKMYLEGLHSRHEAVVQALTSDLKSVDILVRALNVHDVMFLIRRTLFPKDTAMKWRASLPGDPLPIRVSTRENLSDQSHVYYPSLSSQLFPIGGGESIGASIQKLGNMYFAPVLMKIPPQNILPFSQLFSSLYSSDIPYMVSIRLRAGCLSSVNENLASGLSFLPGATNKQITRAYEEVKAMIVDGEIMAGLQIMGCTWAETKSEASRRASLLNQSMQAWGASETTGVVGDPLLGVCGAMGLSSKMPCPTAVPPLAEAIRMCPLSRPVSPWTQGALLLRSADGKILPYQPGSTLQTAWVILGFAPMGFGKSVFLNALNAAMVMLPGAVELPYISVLDIGISSAGLVSMIKSALPKNKQHLVQYIRLTNTKQHAVNVFDTPLGLRNPLPAHRAFLANFLNLICMSQREQATYPNIDGLLRMIVDKVYEDLSDKYNPRRFDQTICPEEILMAMEEFRFRPDDQTTWWEVVDIMMDHKRYHEAMMAQRYAVPMLSDCTSVVRNESVSEIYKDLTPGNVPVTEYVWRQIVDAMNMFPNLSTVTQFDLGETRICAIDLEEVAPAGSDLADRQTAIMYMVARHISCSKFFFKESELSLVPEKYREYHRPIVQAMGTLVKAICYDEFHRTATAQAVRDQVLRDIREGRKWRVLISLFSQRATDFDKSIVDLATSIFILGGGSEEGIRDVSQAFALTETETKFVRNIAKPSEKGSSMLALHITSRGRVIQPAYLTLAPEEIWAYTTTAEDRRVRDMLYQRLEPGLARAVLAKRFPKGSLSRGSKEFTNEDFERIVSELETEAAML